jgi:hypothetical protein
MINDEGFMAFAAAAVNVGLHAARGIFGSDCIVRAYARSLVASNCA